MKSLVISVLKEATGESQIYLETPENDEFGDYATNVAMKIAAKEQMSKRAGKKKPREIAEEIVEKLSKDIKLKKYISKVEVAGPGFINFSLSEKVLLQQVEQILEKGDGYGKSDIGSNKTVIVEYSSPNIAKPFTIGHLRSTIIGDAVANLFEATGWRVYRDNHLGDWGTQFGKQIYAVKTWGDEKEIENSDNPVRELVSLYVKFHKELEKKPDLAEKGREWFKKLEEGDKEARRLWQKCVDWSWREFSRIYKLLGVQFNQEFDDGRGLGESFFENKMAPIVEELENKGFLKEGEDGAKLVFFENDKYPPAMIIKKDGTTLYHTRDLATDKYRLDNFGSDVVIINEVGSEQTLYFRQLFEMEKMLGWIKKGQRVHIAHGLIRFKEQKMSTREGNVIWLQEVLDKAISKAKELGSESDEVAQAVGIGALKYNDLKRDPKSAIIFDWDEILNMQGNSGPYLQYTYARTQSVLRKADGLKLKAKGKEERKKSSNVELSALSYKPNNEELALLRSFVRFSEVIVSVAKNYSPNLICNYLYDLAQKYNNFYNKHGILEQRTKNKEQSKFRLALTQATGTILKNGLQLLGIQAPERM